MQNTQRESYTTVETLPPFDNSKTNVNAQVAFCLEETGVHKKSCEELHLFSVDPCANRILSHALVLTGTSTEIPFKIKTILRAAICMEGLHFIASHNHPSNSEWPIPSKGDIRAHVVLSLLFQYLLDSTLSFMVVCEGRNGDIKYSSSAQHEKVWDYKNELYDECVKRILNKEEFSENLVELIGLAEQGE